MATTVMQAVVLPAWGTLRAGVSNDNDSCGNTRSLYVIATDSPSALRLRNVSLCNSKVITKCIVRRDVTSNIYGDKKQGSRLFSRKNSYSSGAEGAAYVVKEVTDEDLEKQVDPADIRVLAAIRSRYNYISVMEVDREADHLLAGARILLLDNPGCIHTVYYEHNVLTNSYYDVLATVAPLIPDGPVGILGLGAGATAHILHHFFPTLEMHGWELDPDIITIARQFFNLSQLEGSTEAEIDGSSTAAAVKKPGFIDQEIATNEKPQTGLGKLAVHIGDAVGPEVSVEGGFASLIVDLFAEGRVIPALQDPQTWEKLKATLRPGGRIIVNCGGDRLIPGQESKSPGQLYMEETIAAMGKVFPGELSTRYLARKGFNTVAITGPSPDTASWLQALPEPLRDRKSVV